MLDPKEIDKYERRAANAIHGYAADENITVYTYGRDVTALLNERRDIIIELGKWKMLAEEREHHVPVFTKGEVDEVKEDQLRKKART
jgi:hypothetical protein